MTQEEKQLLLKVLSTMLPYHVRCKIWLKDGTIEEGPLDLQHNYGDVLRDAFYYNKIIDIKPYLRPMSSMTEEEAMEYANCGNIIANSPQNNYLIPNHNCVDWLNAHHFDYRGLIEKGLALEAPEGMYNLNK